MLLAVAAPFVDGERKAGAGWWFSGFVGAYQNDYNSYLAWMRQARDGHLLFRDMFTTEPHGRVFFHPVFWLLGTAARLSGFSLTTVWHIAQLLAAAVAILALHRFCAHFTRDAAVRVLALVLITTSSGLGWAAFVSQAPWEQRPIDTWMPEAGLFRALATSFFTLPLALALLLLAFLHALRHFQTGLRRDALLAGLYAAALALTHQYDMVSLFVVLGLFIALRPRERLAGGLFIAGLCLPPCLYSLALVLFDPVFSAHRAAGMESPTASAYLLGWGLPLILGAAALAAPAVWRAGRDVSFLAVWSGVAPVLLALPIGFQRKLAWGVQVPLCLLAAMLAVGLLRALSSRAEGGRRGRVLMVAGTTGLAAACAIGTGGFYRELFEENSARAVGGYLPDEYIEAFRWLEEHGEPEDVVLASTEIAPMIPGRTGHVVFAGHWAQTLDSPGKIDFILRLFGPPDAVEAARARKILRRNRVRYIVLDSASRQLTGLPREGEQFLAAGLGRLELANRFVSIWSLEADGMEAERAWRSGDWRGD